MSEHINTGRDPNEKELRDAERVLSLSPTQQSSLLFWTASPWLVTVSNSGKHFGKGPRPGRNAIGRGGEKRFTFAFAGARSPRNTKPTQLAGYPRSTARRRPGRARTPAARAICSAARDYSRRVASPGKHRGAVPSARESFRVGCGGDRDPTNREARLRLASA